MSHLRQSSRLKALYTRRNRANAAINLTSLMDIFTILVFFLLVNTSEVEVLPSAKSVNLPHSSAEQKPKETLVIVVNDKEITLQGRVVASVSAEMGVDNDTTIAGLKTELEYQLQRQLAAHDAANPFKGEITIMGDKKIPYHLLKKIMLTCTGAKYTNISLAVIQKEKKQG